MGFMDKAKEAALQAKASAEKMAQQGQAKVATMQQSRSEGELYRTLGEAFYNEQRHGGAHEAVAAAITALDEHFAAVAAAPPTAPPATPPAAGQPGTGQPAPGGATPPPGDFTLDNL